MSEPIAATIYATQLTNHCEGYPLWDPDPQDQAPVEIADVGYIEKGAFVRLFNASKQPGDHYANSLGVPEGYQPLQIGEIQKRSPLPANIPIQSDSVLQHGMQLSVSAGLPVQGGSGLSFECSREQGAVLLIGDDADRRDVLHKDTFLRYIHDNHTSWLSFANQVHKRGISLNDLVLVTGCDRTSTWACAAFSGKSSQAGINFNINGPGVQGGLSLSWAWKNSSSVVTRSGPRRSLSLTAAPTDASHLSRDGSLHPRAGGESSRYGNLALTGVGSGTASWASPTRDQCVFLRGYKVCDRRTAIARLLRRRRRAAYDGFHYVPPKKKDRDDPEGPSGSSGGRGFYPNPSSTAAGSYSGGSQPWNPGPSGSTSGLSDADTGQFDDEIDELEEQDIYDQLNNEKDPTPLDLLLEYILEKSTAELALTHDDDLIPLLQNARYVEDFEAWIREVSPTVFIDENRVGMLETSYLLSLSDPVDLSWAANLESKPSTSTATTYPLNTQTSMQHTHEIYSNRIRDTRSDPLSTVGVGHRDLQLYPTATLSQQDYPGLSSDTLRARPSVHRTTSDFSDQDFSDHGEARTQRGDSSPAHSSPHPSTSRSPETTKSPELSRKRYRAVPAKTFACRGYGDCKMVFSRSEHLARHVRKHTGERPFQCHCGKQFSRLDNLRQHAQTVHADKKEDNERMMQDLTALHASMTAAAKSESRKKTTVSRSENHHPSLPNLSSDINSPLNVMSSSYWPLSQNTQGSTFPSSRPS